MPVGPTVPCKLEVILLPGKQLVEYSRRVILREVCLGTLSADTAKLNINEKRHAVGVPRRKRKLRKAFTRGAKPLGSAKSIDMGLTRSLFHGILFAKWKIRKTGKS
jgi:hypothetical protein